MLSDSRFKAMFEDTDFEMDIESEQYRNATAYNTKKKNYKHKDTDDESD